MTEPVVIGDATLLVGDAEEQLRTLSDESVQCVVTSPPYWGLRDYQSEGQIGLEETIDQYIARLVAVFDQVRRVLRADGTLWLNMGDAYAGSWGAQGRNGQMADRSIVSARQIKEHPKRVSRTGSRERTPGLKPKDLIGMPWRIAFALQAAGWYLRSDIIWHKPNPMPESIRDRPTKSHEYLFLLSKLERYYYDAEAIKEPVTGNAHARGSGVNPKATKVPDGWDTKPGAHGTIHREGRGSKVYRPRPRQNDSWSEAVTETVDHRNKRSVWTVPSRPYKEAHFATFPEALVEPCILAATSEKGACPHCGAPWVRVTERQDQGWNGSKYGERAVAATGGAKSGGTARSTLGSSHGQLTGKSMTAGWQPSCQCPDHESVPCTVLDPFSGTATTGVVALKHGRKYIGIDLSGRYMHKFAVPRVTEAQKQQRLAL